MVGAPKGQDSYQPEIDQPGALYKCPYPGQGLGQCSQVDVDSTGNTEQSLRFHGRKIKFHHHKDGQWLGVALDVRPDDHSSLLVCAHRWTDSFLMKKLDDISHMNGMCYQLGGNLNATGRLVPALTKLDRLVNRRLRYAEFSMGSLGMAAKFTDIGGELLMGAPGLNDWSGGLAIEKDSNSPRDLRYIEPVHSIYHDSYIGYAITTGSFLSRRAKNIALGAPKANGVGKVFIFDLSNPRNSPQISITGSQTGSYFGAALCTMTVNGDRWDDILVGAPLSQDTGSEQGRVFIYISRGPMGFIKSSTELTGSSSRNARFGSAIVNLGDINKDGFQDVAVGSPFESDSRGAVYVYLGYRKGVWPSPTQIIHAHTLDPGLRGFGGSFSRPYDIDANGYNDIAVGAHISNQAVLLRTRPITNLAVTFIVAPRKIDPDNICTDSGLPYPCARVKFCFVYNVKGRPIPDEIDIQYTLSVDVTRGFRSRRAVFIEPLKNATLQEMTSLTGSFVLLRHTRSCSPLQTFFLKRTDDPFEDILVELQFSETYRKSNSITPMIAPFVANNDVRPSRSSLERKISIRKNCGFDDICRSNLHLQKQIVTFGATKHNYVIGDVDYVRVNVSLQNNGEIAYGTILKWTIPKNLAFRTGWKTMTSNAYMFVCNIGTVYSNSSTYDVMCDVGDVSVLDGSIDVSIDLSLAEEFLSQNFTIVSRISTLSNDASQPGNMEDVSGMSNVKVKFSPNIQVTGFSTPDHHVLTSVFDDADHENITHTYDVTNYGRSSPSHGMFTVTLPVKDDYLIVRGFTVDSEWTHTCEMDQGRVLPDKNGSRMSSDPDKMLIDCERMPCVILNCSVSDITAHQSMVVSVHFTVWRKFFTLHKAVRYFRLESTAQFSYPDYQGWAESGRTTGALVTTDILLYEKTIYWQDLELWIVLVSLCGGVFLSLLIAILLLKVGFFKRPYREDLKTLKKLRKRHCGRSRISSNETCDGGEDAYGEGGGSHENLMITTDYRAVTYDQSGGESSPDSPISRKFDDTDYLEPIQTLLR